MAVSLNQIVKTNDPYLIRAARLEKGILSTRKLAKLTKHDEKIIKQLEDGTMPNYQAHAFACDIMRFLRNY